MPDRTTPIGKMIDSYLQSTTEMDDHTIHLLFSANRWERAAYIRESIAAGYTIVCDRFHYSGVVYSAAKKNPTLSLEWAKSPEIGLPRPDLVIFLDISPEDAEKRGGYGEEKYEKREMQQRVREMFLDLRYDKDFNTGDMKIIDAGKDREEVGESIWSEVEKIVGHVENKQGFFSSAELRVVEAW